MEKAVFRKENVFTCVMFGALVLFVVVETIMAPESLPAIAFFVAISVFALSIIKVSADIAESMNDKLTTHMKVVENRWKSQHGSFRFRTMREAPEDEAEKLIAAAVPTGENQDNLIGGLRNYRIAYYERIGVRKTRRALLYVYYFVFMLLFVLLLTHSEMALLLEPAGILDSNFVSILTLWPLAVVLFDVMMKTLAVKAAVPILEQKLGFELKLY